MNINISFSWLSLNILILFIVKQIVDYIPDIQQLISQQMIAQIPDIPTDKWIKKNLILNHSRPRVVYKTNSITKIYKTV